MRRLFVCPHDVWFQHHRNSGFHPVAGSHWLELSGGLILVSAEFHTEASEATWYDHPDVAPLPDPVYDGKISLAAHRDNPDTKYSTIHHDALKAIGIVDTDTVMEVSRKAAAIHPLVQVRHTL